MTRNEIIKAYWLTDREVSYLDLFYGPAWFEHKDPAMYITVARREMEEHYCPECGCSVNASDWEDYRMCSRCHDRYCD